MLVFGGMFACKGRGQGEMICLICGGVMEKNLSYFRIVESGDEEYWRCLKCHLDLSPEMAMFPLAMRMNEGKWVIIPAGCLLVME